MRLASLMMVAWATVAHAEGPGAGKEMLSALERVNRALGLESTPPPHCLKWGYGHQITAGEVLACAGDSLKGAPLPGLGKSYVLAILMSSVGPQTIIALALDAPGWAVLSCDPGRPCPPRKAGTDKMGKRVIDRSERACNQESTLWLPARAGCPDAPKAKPEPATKTTPAPPDAGAKRS